MDNKEIQTVNLVKIRLPGEEQYRTAELTTRVFANNKETTLHRTMAFYTETNTALASGAALHCEIKDHPELYFLCWSFHSCDHQHGQLLWVFSNTQKNFL